MSKSFVHQQIQCKFLLSQTNKTYKCSDTVNDNHHKTIISKILPNLRGSYFRYIYMAPIAIATPNFIYKHLMLNQNVDDFRYNHQILLLQTVNLCLIKVFLLELIDNTSPIFLELLYCETKFTKWKQQITSLWIQYKIFSDNNKNEKNKDLNSR